MPAMMERVVSMSDLRGVQIRLMGDAAAVDAVARAMVASGLIAITGGKRNDDGGMRVYGVAVAPAAEAPKPAKAIRPAKRPGKVATVSSDTLPALRIASK